ncbi:hypothetical protein ACP3BN_002727 [Enterococcus hirae]
MKKVLLTVSLLANVVLAGGLIYATMETNKLDDQRENLQIANDQLERKLDGSTSTSEGAPEATEEATSVSSNSMDNVPQNVTESSIALENNSGNAQGSAEGIKLYKEIYHFGNFSGSVVEGAGESQMSEHFTKRPIIVTDSSGTYNADLYTNSDGTAQIMKNDRTIFYGTHEIDPDTVPAATDRQSIADYKELGNIIRNNPDRNQQMQALQNTTFKTLGVDGLRTALLNKAAMQNIGNEEYNTIAQRILQQCELAAGQGEQ